MRTQAGGFSSHHISTDWLVNLATGWTLEWGNRPRRHHENRPSSHSFSPGRNSAASSGAVGVAYLLGVLVKVTENTRQQLDLHFVPFFILFLWDLGPFHTYQSLQRVTPCTGKERSGRVTSTASFLGAHPCIHPLLKGSGFFSVFSSAVVSSCVF